MTRGRWLSVLSVVLVGCATGAPAGHAAPLARADVRQTLSDQSRDAVARSPVATLFFGTEPDGRAAVITAGPHFYAVSLRREGHTLALHGVDQVHAEVEDEDGEGAPPTSNATVRGTAALLLVNEGIRSVAWEEEGAYWALEVECERPFDDVRCTDDAYLFAEAEALASLAEAP